MSSYRNWILLNRTVRVWYNIQKKISIDEIVSLFTQPNTLRLQLIFWGNKIVVIFDFRIVLTVIKYALKFLRLTAVPKRMSRRYEKVHNPIGFCIQTFILFMYNNNISVQAISKEEKYFKRYSSLFSYINNHLVDI